MPHRGVFVARNWCLLAACLCTLSLSGQSGVDLSVHFSPQLRYVDSERNSLPMEGGASIGENGLAFGYDFGGAIEFRVIDNLYLRGGIDIAHKRQEYSVKVLNNDALPTASGSNKVAFRAIEVPVQAIYRFGFMHDNANFLVGIGVVALRFVGDPQVEAELSERDRTGFESLVTSGHSVSVFAGYDRYISKRVIASIEPYLSYVPDKILLESHTTTSVQLEAGVRLRLTLDN